MRARDGHTSGFHGSQSARAGFFGVGNHVDFALRGPGTPQRPSALSRAQLQRHAVQFLHQKTPIR